MCSGTPKNLIEDGFANCFRLIAVIRFFFNTYGYSLKVLSVLRVTFFKQTNGVTFINAHQAIVQSKNPI
jgi:hypothetical protein